MLSVYRVAILGVDNSWVKALFIVLPIFVLEPLMVSLTGGTIGHHLRGIKVIDVDSENKINIFAAILRFILKVLLGWLSILTILSSKRHQAMHDFAARSRVVNKAGSAALSVRDNLPERFEDAGFRYPSILLRLVMIMLYSIAAMVLLAAVFAVLLAFAESCSPDTWCIPAIQIILGFGSYFLLAVLGAIIVYGWRARLYGCRRKPVNEALGKD